MLELDIHMEEQDVKSYLAHAALAEKIGMIELKMKLDQIAADEAGHVRTLRRLCKGIGIPMAQVIGPQDTD
jgi:rubrerythrin